MNHNGDEFSEFFGAASPASPVQVLNKTSEIPPLIGERTKIKRYALQKESPRHRLIIELAAKGYSYKEIAEYTGLSYLTVENTLMQPALQGTIVQTIRANADSIDHKVVEVIKENVLNAVTFLADTVKNVQARTTDRIAAAEKLLERRYGKANQPINRGTDVDLNSLSDAELAAMIPETQATGTSEQV